MRGSVSASSPESTAKPGGRSRRIAMIWARSPDASLMPAMFSASRARVRVVAALMFEAVRPGRSEEHTSELQSRLHLVCRLLLEKKKNQRVSAYCDHRHHTRFFQLHA